MNIEVLNQIDSELFRTDLPELKIGDRIELTISKSNINEKKGTFLFRGIIISIKNPNRLSYSFTVMREVNKLVINSVFFYHLTPIIKINKIVGKTLKIRRAKLYYLNRILIKKKQGE